MSFHNCAKLFPGHLRWDAGISTGARGLGIRAFLLFFHTFNIGVEGPWLRTGFHNHRSPRPPVPEDTGRPEVIPEKPNRIMELERLLHFLDDFLEIPDHPDFDGAMNGLQVQGPDHLEHLAVAVDVSEATVEGAVDSGADLLLVHHGLFWGGLGRVTGRLYRKLSNLIRNDVGLYSVHLPLDAHAEVGNAAVLARELGVEVDEPFGRFRDTPVGWSGILREDRRELLGRMEACLGRSVHLIPGGAEHLERVAVVTGSGGSFIQEAADGGLDALITGEGKHHDYVEATELGINVFYGGHYATETWGVRALARRLEETFSLSWTFIDDPSGL